jgi:hypothetical protein
VLMVIQNHCGPTIHPMSDPGEVGLALWHWEIGLGDLRRSDACSQGRAGSRMFRNETLVSCRSRRVRVGMPG